MVKIDENLGFLVYVLVPKMRILRHSLSRQQPNVRIRKAR